MKKIIINIKLKFMKILSAILPEPSRSKLTIPHVGRIDFGDLRRLQPIDPDFGFKRGCVIDRYYIDKFLTRFSQNIHGCVLEMGGTEYTKKYGGSKVSRIEVLHYIPGNGYATIVGDLTNAETLEANFFDCIILTQTLQLIYDFKSAIHNLYRALKPNGVVLVTTHGTSKIDNFIGKDPWGEYWRFTGQSSQIAFEDSFGKGNVEVLTYGNILSATAFLQGLVVEDLSLEELEFHDPRFEVLVGIRAVKRSSL